MAVSDTSEKAARRIFSETETLSPLSGEIQDPFQRGDGELVAAGFPVEEGAFVNGLGIGLDGLAVDRREGEGLRARASQLATSMLFPPKR
jgi:hypothetical protein